MRTRLVFWGKDDLDEKVLIGIKLNEVANNIDVYIFPQGETTEEFVTKMHQQWRVGQDLEFPENHKHVERPLSISEPMIPEGYSVDREDILKRAQTEWHFIVLSSKLFQTYKEELAELREKIAGLSRFDSVIWEDLKGFWAKVQEQVRERNLFRDHSRAIRESTNELFADLKRMRKELDQEFHQVSERHAQAFREKLEAIEKKIEEGLSLQPIFQELKEIQKSFRDTKFTRDHRSQIWKKLDGLFKQVKEKKFGPGSSRRSNSQERVQRRYDGLIQAIQKMERSIKRDRDDLQFQNQKIEDAEGSLEAQIRAAKTKMIEERIISKEDKLVEMKKTQAELERKLEVLRQKEEQRKESEEVEQVKSAIKEKIAREIKEAQLAREGNEALQKAAQSITKSHPEVSLAESLESGLEDVVDTIKAVAAVIESKVEKVIEDLTEEE